MKITDVTSEVFEWERPGIWNGGHFYGPGRLHKVTVHTDEGITGYGWNGGTAAERPLKLFPGYVDYFRPLVVGRDPASLTISVFGQPPETDRDQIAAFLHAGAERVSVWASHCETEAEMGEQLERMADALIA